MAGGMIWDQAYEKSLEAIRRTEAIPGDIEAVGNAISAVVEQRTDDALAQVAADSDTAIAMFGVAGNLAIQEVQARADAALDPVTGEIAQRVRVDAAMDLSTSAQAIGRANLKIGPSQPREQATVSTSDFANAQAPVALPSLRPLRPTLTQQTVDLMRGMNYGDRVDLSHFSSVDDSPTLQDDLLVAQKVAYAFIKPNLEGLLFHSSLEYTVPRTRAYLSSPLVLPESVCFKGKAQIIAKPTTPNGSLATWNGDPIGQALTDKHQPIVIAGMRSDIPELNVFAGWTSELVNSGLVVGKNWTATSLALVSGGSGYVVGNLVYLAQPSVAPYKGAVATVTSVDGNGAITGFALSDAGAYSLPPAQQATQWTSAAGFTNARGGGAIFAAPGVFATTSSGTGTGATFSINWRGDFNGNDGYDTGNVTIIGDTHIGRYRYNGQKYGTFVSGRGPTFGLLAGGYNHTFEDIEIIGGYFGCYVKLAADFRGPTLNVVNAARGLVILQSSGAHCPNVVLDTCSLSHLQINQSQFCTLTVNCLTAPTGSGADTPILIGDNPFFTVGAGNVGLTLAINVTGACKNGPAAYLARSYASKMTFNIINMTNLGAAVPVARRATAVAVVGPGWDVSNTVEGRIDNVPGPLFVSAGFTASISGAVLTVTGTPVGALAVGQEIWSGASYYGKISALGTGAGASGTYTLDVTQGSAITSTSMTSITATFPLAGGVRFWDAAANGWCKDGGIYEITGVGVPTNATGVAKARKGSSYTDTATGTRYTNTGTHIAPVWA